MKQAAGLPFFFAVTDIKKIGGIACLVTGIGLLLTAGYYFYPDIMRYAGQFDAQGVADLLKKVRGSFWAPFYVVLIYVAAGMVFFPVTIISLGVAAAFGPWLGILYGMLGALTSASLTFWIGNTSRGQWLYKLIPARIIKKFDHKLKKGGISTAAILRMVIFAPFSLFNLVMGVSKVKFQDFFAGTILGMLPGFIARAFVGGSLMSLLINPSTKDIAYLSGGLMLWLALVLGTKVISKKLKT